MLIQIKSTKMTKSRTKSKLKPDFKLSSFLKLFDDDNLSKQAFSPFFILGELASVASAPDLILPSEWNPILSRDEEKPIEFVDPSQFERFNSSIQDWWNDCVEHFDGGEPIGLIEKLKFTKKNGPSPDLKEFVEGYLYANDWLSDEWDEHLDPDGEESSLVGMTTLLALQISLWPERPISEEEFPDLVGEASVKSGEVASLIARLISSVGELGLTISREDMKGEFQEPVINPDRHVGRNDPCICGSGKKFKKCCLH